MILLVKVIPNAKKSAFDGRHGEYLRIRIKAPADKGKANEELINFLSEELDIPKSKITILSGATCRLKRIAIDADITF